MIHNIKLIERHFPKSAPTIIKVLLLLSMTALLIGGVLLSTR